MINYIKWLLKIGWVKIGTTSEVVYIDGECIGAEFTVAYQNVKTGAIRRSWIPAVP